MTTIRDSNTAFLTILDPLPQENIGWWLEFYDFQTQNLLARVYSYLDFSFSVPLSDVGACEINMSDYDPLWTSTLPNTQPGTYLLDGGPHFVDFIDEGVRRQRCIMDKHTLAKVREDGSRPRQITGKGIATVLDWGVVLPVSIGASTSGNRVFTGVHWAGVWRTLFLEAQARGAIPSWVTTSFDTTNDSYGVPWGDVGNYEIPEGQSLLDLLQQFQEQHGFEWRMYSSGLLAAAPTLGDDRSSTVRFFEHESIVTADDSSDRQDLRTHVYVLGGDNLVTLASDTPAATTWGRREKWVNQSSATDSNARTAVANTLLGLAKNPINSRTFKVPFDPTDPATGASTHRRAFTDYETGFVVGYGPNTDPSTNFRIVEMAVQVDPDKTELEITVMSRTQREIDRLSKLLARILTGQTGISGVGGASGSISSTVIAAAIRLGDLLNVHVGSAVAKDTIVFDGTNWNSGRSALDDLSDVDVSTASPGQVLTLGGGGLWTAATAGGSGISPTALHDAILTLSPFGYWPLNETSGTAAANAGSQGTAGVYTGGFTLNQNPMMKGASRGVLLNGSSGWIQVPSAAYDSLTTWTVCAMIFPKGDGVLVASKYTGGNVPVYVGAGVQGSADRINTGRFSGGGWSTCASLRSVVATPRLVVATLGAGTAAIWINGIKHVSAAITSGGAASAAELRIGQRWDGGNFWNGFVSDVAIWGSVLSDAQIQTIFASVDLQ